MLGKFILENQEDWDIKTPLVTAAYRNHPHAATKFTPNKLHLGRELNTPLSLLYGTNNTQLADNYVDYVQNLDKDINLINEIVINNTKNLPVPSTSDDLSYKTNKFKIGDIVYWYNKQTKNKLSPKLTGFWRGPYIVTAQKSTIVYEISNGFTKGKRIINQMYLKKSRLTNEDLSPELVRFRNKVISENQ